MKLETLEECIGAYGKEVYGFCLYLTHSRPEAEDLYQDTFLNLMERGEVPDPERNPRSYLISVAVHLWTNRKRKAAWRQRITGTQIPMEEQLEDLPSGASSPEEQIITDEEQEQVRSAVKTLPDKYRIPILLFYMEQLQISEIAQILRLKDSTVKTRLHRAKKRLEKELEAILE